MIKSFSIFLFIVATAAFSWYWTRPLLGDIDQMKAEIAVIEKALADSRELQQMRDLLFERYSSVPAGGLERISKLIPDDPETAKLLVEVENLGKVSGVIVKNLDIAETKTGPSLSADAEGPVYEKSLLTIKIAASYGSLKEFLSRLQKSLRLIDVTEITFSAAEKDFYEFTIKAQSYFKK